MRQMYRLSETAILFKRPNQLCSKDHTIIEWNEGFRTKKSDINCCVAVHVRMRYSDNNQY